LCGVKVPIHDARPIRHELSLDRQGFALVDHKSVVTDFENSEEVQRLYPAEIERVIKDLSGASMVGILPTFLLRHGVGSSKTSPRVNSWPVHFVHSDYSETSAQKFARTRFFRDRELRPGHRIAGFTIWRAVSPGPQDIPLAVCDVRSIAPADGVLGVIDARGAPETRFESTLYFHNPAHRWHYFRDMTRDEALVFKSYDSDPSRPQYVPHTAFNDPSCPLEASTRVSIEARAFAYF